MSKIQLAENIPTHEGKEYPYLAVVQVVGKFPIATEFSARNASVELVVVPYRVVQDGAEEIRIAHPTIERTLTVEQFSPSTLSPLAAALIAANIAEWASAEVIA
jgi:hypothetical protein